MDRSVTSQWKTEENCARGASDVMVQKKQTVSTTWWLWVGVYTQRVHERGVQRMFPYKWKFVYSSVSVRSEYADGDADVVNSTLCSSGGSGINWQCQGVFLLSTFLPLSQCQPTPHWIWTWSVDACSGSRRPWCYIMFAAFTRMIMIMKSPYDDFCILIGFHSCGTTLKTIGWLQLELGLTFRSCR